MAEGNYLKDCNLWRVIRLDKVCKRYNDRVVLHPLTLEIPSQSNLALIGPSGCGKSTLLRMILGLIPPDSGTIEIDGQVMSEQNRRQMRQSIGYVIQDGGLFPHLTAADNVCLMARHLGWSSDKMLARLTELADLVHLPGELLSRFPAEMSGGQRQRVGIMRALMLDPSTLLMDEPMGALDPLVRHQLQEDLRVIFKDMKKTVIVVTHDMGEASFLGDQLALLKDGRIAQRGSFKDMVDNPAEPFVTEFLNAQKIAWPGGAN